VFPGRPPPVQVFTVPDSRAWPLGRATWNQLPLLLTGLRQVLPFETLPYFSSICVEELIRESVPLSRVASGVPYFLLISIFLSSRQGSNGDFRFPIICFLSHLVLTLTRSKNFLRNLWGVQLQSGTWIRSSQRILCSSS